jgi:hypothetical protein
MADTDDENGAVDLAALIAALKQQQPQSAPPTIEQALEHQKRWGMPPAEEQIPGIITNTVERTIGAPIVAAKRLGEATTAGTLDVTDPSTAADAFNLVGGIAGARTPFAEPGAAGIFGGELARTADRAALTRARQMAQSGAHPTDIWNNTGWFQGADNKWRFEIPDKSARWTAEPGYGASSTTTVQDVLKHPELYEAYPDIANMPISRTHPRLGWSGLYTPPSLGEEAIQINRADPSSPRSVLLHELQHAVQEREGFDPGGMPDVNLSDPRYRDVSQAEVYRRGAGETEARAVERRQTWSARQRQEQPPLITQSQDVPILLQILKGQF